MLRSSDLQSKEIINIETGGRLGMIIDLDVDLEAGEVKGIVVPKEESVFNFFGKNEDLYIPWSDIYKIGEDVILVRAGQTNTQQPEVIESN
jgi:YlmC/YmxH family sporulation protein